MSFATGALVHARGREWVVLPGSSSELLLVRPLGGTDEESTGILTALEEVRPASFPPPDPTRIGDHRSCRLLRDALRLGFRSSAGPFRSFGQIAVEPRPYQLVPLLMALRQEPVRLLIADDVGVGKTIEALLVAKELLARGDVQRLAVLCPPHLAEQWQRELAEKFQIEAELVLPSTVRRLERGLPFGTSLFEAYPFVVVSIDFIKGDRYRDEFARTCPELVIVDEAHGATQSALRAQQLRHQLVGRLATDPSRHLILVTATPHSGNEQAFRSLLGLLDPSLAELPEDLSGPANETRRRTLARYLIQRRRADVEHYLGADTVFPQRDDREETYTLSEAYRRLFDRVLAYARERVRDPEGDAHRQRVRWWAALGLLRALGSSPAAAAATLRTRAQGNETETLEEADEVGRRAVLDLIDDESMEGRDVAPGADDQTEAEADEKARNRRQLLAMAREADGLAGEEDRKLQRAVELIRDLVADGFHPMVFCRFIPTAEYVGEHLRVALQGVEVAAVTGRLPPEEREARVLALSEHDRRVLVATDCLSEGINLQDHFDAVFHYDLSWNPTRHEQREGRVDRFGQPRKVVRTVTFYGSDNPIDGIVLDVLVRKSKAIRKHLGVSVPVPTDSESVVEAIFEGLLLREQAGFDAQRLPGFEEFFRPQREDLHRRWDRSADRERHSRTMFAQESLKPEEVARELEEVRAAIGSGADVRRFVTSALTALGATIRPDDEALGIDLSGLDRSVRDVLGLDTSLRAGFEQPAADGVVHLTRTHPLVESLTQYVLDTALDPRTATVASRCGAIRTATVERRTTLLLLRYRFDVTTKARGGAAHVQLAEDAGLVAFEGPPEDPTWLAPDTTEALLDATPTANIGPDQARAFTGRVLNGLDHLAPHLEETARQRAEQIRQAHERVRHAGQVTGLRTTVEPKLPVDILGVYVLLPAPRSAT